LDQKRQLPFNIEVMEVPRSIIDVSATQVRKWIKEDDSQKLKDFLGEYTLQKLSETL